MDRLTTRGKNGFVYAGKKQMKSCDPWFCHNALECSKIVDRSCKHLQMIDKLAAYEDEEEAGLLVRLPCKIGDTVYEADFGDGYSEPKVYKRVVRGFKHTVYTIYPFCDIDAFGNTVFLTREAAEAALKEIGKHV